jgi:hypothetical protein
VVFTPTSAPSPNPRGLATARVHTLKAICNRPSEVCQYWRAGQTHS